MAALTGNSISSSYTGLLKTNDNGVLSATEQVMTDGAGNSSTLSMGTASASFTGTLDLSGATITGLPGGGGLVLGTGQSTNGPAYLSMVSGSAVTNTTAIAAGGGAIALGENARSTSTNGGWASNSIAIGSNSTSNNASGVAIGSSSTVNERGVAIGLNSNAGIDGTAIGKDTNADGSSVAIGRNSDSGAASSVAIGDYAGYLGPFAATNAVMIGHDNGFAAGAQSISLGFNSTAKSTDSIAIGHDARVDTSAHTGAICIGEDTRSGAVGAVALGANITASIANTVSVNALEIQSNTDSITMYSPDGTEWKVTVTNAGTLLVTNA